jgi:serine phosphatase RsbU (regulator of sigma subunit)/PAS domain-containing protein
VNVRADREAAELLIEAGAVLASSLDLATTMHQVARLTVPSVADVCVIDLCGEDGTIGEVAVAAHDEELAARLEAMRGRHPLDPHGPHPVALVIQSGEPMLLAELSATQLSSFAAGAEHARLMISSGYRSAIVAPLVARSRTLGAISVLRVGEREPYEESDLEFVNELARRAAPAIDNARLFGDLERLESLQEAILANLAEAITVMDPSGRTVFANQAAADLLLAGSPEEITAAEPGSIAKRFLILDEQARELDLDTMPAFRLFRGEKPGPLLVRNVVRATGEERWLIVRCSPILDPQTGAVRLAVNVFENITEVKRAQLTESFMAQASRVLAGSMDYAETLRRIARLAVPQIADWCAIDLLGPAGEIEQVAVHHADPEMVALAEDLGRRYPRADSDGGPVADVIRTGAARIYTEIGPQELAAYVREDPHMGLLGSIGAKSVLIVPLLSAVQTLGAITLVSSTSPRRLSAVDIALAERLARRAGTAVENARLYTERSRIAHTLQRALLPETLPSIPGADVQARYRAAGELNEVGGDFYDVFPRTDGWMLVIGDVVGKGARAAGVTALARHTLRASSMGGGAPADMLRMLHRALRAQSPGADMCTVCLVEVALSPGRARLTVTLAGHPLPLLVGSDGEVHPVGRPGTLLGVIDPVRVSETAVELAPGETLLLYTDGVLDAGRTEAPLGEQGLIDLCRTGAGQPLEALLERIEQAALERAGGGLRDDIAVLGLRLR